MKSLRIHHLHIFPSYQPFLHVFRDKFSSLKYIIMYRHIFNIPIWARLFAWLLLRLKQPQQTSCLFTSKIQFNFSGPHNNSCFEREFSWDPTRLNCVFDISKHYVCCGCFKRRSNHANKRAHSVCKCGCAKYFLFKKTF